MGRARCASSGRPCNAPPRLGRGAPRRAVPARHGTPLGRRLHARQRGGIVGDPGCGTGDPPPPARTPPQRAVDGAGGAGADARLCGGDGNGTHRDSRYRGRPARPGSERRGRFGVRGDRDPDDLHIVVCDRGNGGTSPGRRTGSARHDRAGGVVARGASPATALRPAAHRPPTAWRRAGHAPGHPARSSRSRRMHHRGNGRPVPARQLDDCARPARC